ncbi:hypothetical protein SS50377_23613 [Spironucleus salmonicida]|uniref:Uncharacterized protein n=1 Tax=Spironucleus salmonicida TaxID=348837 RepID=V6LVH4_9EUKA|nr:hypothetical protein SS50377_23613 [Spironucleus salmonicida]|eukprot:EST48595.1 Hypothetical protein SS50377_11207 [Spironucleus salmonicida]
MQVSKPPLFQSCKEITSIEIQQVSQELIMLASKPVEEKTLKEVSIAVKTIILKTHPSEINTLQLVFKQEIGQNLLDVIKTEVGKKEFRVIAKLLSKEDELVISQIQRLQILIPPQTWFIIGMFLGISQEIYEQLEAKFLQDKNMLISEYIIQMLNRFTFEQMVIKKWFNWKFVKLDSNEQIINNIVSQAKNKMFQPDKFVYSIIQLRQRNCVGLFKAQFIKQVGQDIYTFVQFKFDEDEQVIVQLILDIIIDRRKALLDFLFDMVNNGAEYDNNELSFNSNISIKSIIRGFTFDLDMVLSYTHLFRYELPVKQEFSEFQYLLFNYVKGQTYRYILDLWGFE